MIICPVCEHPQAQGLECDNCGKKLQTPRAVAVPVAPLPELEQTQHAGGRVAVDAPALPELERTRLRVGPDLPPQVVPELAPTRVEATRNVPVAPLPELDRGRAPDDGVRTAAPQGAVVCRYCRNVQAEGLICDRCGMRLPRARPATPEVRGAAGQEGGSWVPCPQCHTPNRPGRVCSSCGTRLQAES